MASTTPLLLLLPVLVSLTSATHFMGGKTTVTYIGQNPDGTFKVQIHNKDTFGHCLYSLLWSCYQGQCGSRVSSQRGIIDSNSHAPSGERLWCETETVETMNIHSDKPFTLRASGCCWVNVRNGNHAWRLSTFMDLGKRSDTVEPNRSPDTSILPLLRTPRYCLRTYQLIVFDPDGDKVRCRYGKLVNVECSRCSLPKGFHLDEDLCILQYNSGTPDSRIYSLEMVVEDFPQSQITLTYSDGSKSVRAPIHQRVKRQATPPPQTTTPWWWGHMATTKQQYNYWLGHTTATPNNAQYTTPWWWHYMNPTTATPTKASTTQTITPRWWSWQHLTSAAPATSAEAPTSASPLSKLRLQFSFLVDGSISTCERGVYLPTYLSPTPGNGDHIHAEVGKEVEIRVRVYASHATIQNIIFSGPQNTRKSKVGHNEFAISWTPTSDHLGHHYVICFTVEAQSSFRIFQADMRCVIMDVEKHVEAHVTCGESTMMVAVEKSSLPRLTEDHLQLSDPSNVVCSLKTHSNRTHVKAIIPLDTCGTQIEEDDDYIKFKNEITTVNKTSNMITRKHLLEVQFYCQYPKRGNVAQSFLAHRKSVTVWEKGFGRFTYQFEFYPNTLYQTMIDPNSYPLTYELGNPIYMQVEAKTTVNNTELFVESCRAAPYDNPNYRPVYSIIENGCAVDSTVVTYTPDHERQFRFSMEAFKFIGLYDQVYISCSVLMCRAGDPNTRCSQGCINSTQSSNNQRRKRAAVAQSSTHLVSQGPLRLRRSAEVTESPELNLNLNLVFIAGCLLAAIGMVSGVVVYKAKASRVKYQPLPTFEG